MKVSIVNLFDKDRIIEEEPDKQKDCTDAGVLESASDSVCTIMSTHTGKT